MKAPTIIIWGNSALQFLGMMFDSILKFLSLSIALST